MARLPRCVVAGLPYFVIHRGVKGQSIFWDDQDIRAYRQALIQASREAGVAVHGYGLCDDEVRLLLTPSTTESLSAMMQSVGRRYVRRFNLRHHRSGTPWEGRFRSAVIDATDWFMRCLQYAESCVTEEPASTWTPALGDACRSSAAHHLGLRIDGSISEHGMFWATGNTPFDREVAHQRLLTQPLPDAVIECIRSATLKGWALGSPAFAKSIEKMTGRRHKPLPRGRPRLPEGKNGHEH